MVVLPEMPVRMACEQEECLEEEIFIRSLPELCIAQKGGHKDGIQLETPKVNTMEVSELPREIKLEIPIEQSKSKLHTKWKKVLGSKVIRRENPIKLIKREICRPPPKPPDRQNSQNHKHETKKESQEAHKIERELNYRPPPKLPYILDTNGEVIGIIEIVVPKTRPPLKTPRIHGSVDREGIGQEKECLLDTVSNKTPTKATTKKFMIESGCHGQSKFKMGHLFYR